MNKLVVVATILGRKKKEQKISSIFQDFERPNDIDAQCVRAFSGHFNLDSSTSLIFFKIQFVYLIT